MSLYATVALFNWINLKLIGLTDCSVASAWRHFPENENQVERGWFIRKQ